MGSSALSQFRPSIVWVEGLEEKVVEQWAWVLVTEVGFEQQA